MKRLSLSQLPVKQRQTVVTLASVGGLFVVVLCGLLLTDPHHQPDQRTPAQKSANDVVKNFRTPGTATDPAGVWITNSEAKLKELNATNTDLQHQVNEMKGQLLMLEKGTRARNDTLPPLPGEGTTTPTPPPTAINTSASATTDLGSGSHSRGPISTSASLPKDMLPPPPLKALRGTGITPTLMPSGGILEVNLSSPADATLPVSPNGSPSSASSRSNASAGGGPDAASKSPTSASTILDTLPAGSFASAILLTGLDAPTGGTAKTNPMPIVMRLLNRGTLPNSASSRVRDCFVTGAAYGDLSAERAYVRLEQLSCVMKDGSIIDNTIEGFIAGEDGKNGLRGKVVSKQGQMIGMAMLAGFASGMGQSISSSYATVSTSPLGATTTVNPSNVFQSGAASGFGKALDKIADFYIARANDLFPIVEVDSGRRGDILLTKPAKLGPAYAQAWEAHP